MFSVYSERKNEVFRHEVKALGIIWSKFPNHYSAANTLHVDDLGLFLALSRFSLEKNADSFGWKQTGRNFAMNPKNGIKVHAYRDALSRDNVSSDIELLYVAR